MFPLIDTIFLFGCDSGGISANTAAVEKKPNFRTVYISVHQAFATKIK